MKLKFLTLVAVAIAFVAAFLPMSSVEGGGVAVSQAVWSDEKARIVITVGLALVGVLTATTAGPRVRRAWTIPMVVTGGFLALIATMMAKGYSSEKTLADGTHVVSSQGSGFVVIFAVFIAVTAFGVYGTIRPETRST